MNQFTQYISASGHVVIHGLYENGRKELLWSNHNVLTTNFFTTMPKLLAGQVGTLEGPTLRTVSIGTANWANFMRVGGGVTPATTGDVNVETPLGSDIPITSTTFGTPSPGSTTLIATLPAGNPGDDINTNPLSEVGLFTEAGVMIARQVHTTIEKNSTFQLQYTWTITFRS